MGKKIIVANWKMYLTLRESVALARRLAKLEIRPNAPEQGSVRGRNSKLEIVVCPSFVALEEVAKIVKKAPLKLGAQDVEPERRGAYTGEVGLDDLKELGVQYVLVGHSERRRRGETDMLVNRKLKAVLAVDIRPILCVGEPWNVRRAKKEKQFVRVQIKAGLKGIPQKDWRRVVIAYEPVWAIGTDRADTPQDASEIHEWIRKSIIDIYGGRTSGQTEERPHVVPILYGGSVNPTNAHSFSQAPGVYGLLVGRASTSYSEFTDIVRSTTK